MEGCRDHFLSGLRSFLTDPDTECRQSRLILYGWKAHTWEKAPAERGEQHCRHRKEVLLVRHSYFEVHNAKDPVYFYMRVHKDHLL